MGFDLLEKPVGTIDLLLHLLRRGRSSPRDIQAETGMSKESFYRAADRLTSLGFVYEVEETGFPTFVYYALTSAGEAIARVIAPAAEILAVTARAMEEELARLEAADDPATTARRIQVLEVVVDRAFATGRWGDARTRAERLGALAASVGDRRREASAGVTVGSILQKQDAHDEAVRTLEGALRLATAAGAGDLASDAEYLIGADLERRGRWPDAASRYRSAEGLAERAQDFVRRARARLATARVLGRQGQLPESLALHREVVSEFERLRAEDELPRAYGSLASTAYHMDRPDAVEWAEKAVEAARRVSDPRIEAHGLSNAAASWIGAKEYRKAEAYLKRARTIFEALGERSGVAAAELNLGNVARAEGRWSDGEAHFERALALARETGNRFQEAHVVFDRGLMMKQRSHREEAIALLTEARRLFRELGSAARAARCDEVLRELTG